eukprot:g15388.t1
MSIIVHAHHANPLSSLFHDIDDDCYPTAVDQFHPTEDSAVSASEDGTAKVWDLTNWSCVKSLEEHNKKHEVLRACWAPPGAWNNSVSIATGSADGNVRLWGIPSGDRDFSSDGGDETGAGRYKSLKVVGQLRHSDQAKGLDGQVYSCQFIADTAGAAGQAQASPTGLLTASDNSVHLWDVETRTRVASRALSKVGEHSIGGERNPEDMSFVFDAKPRPGSGSSVLAVALSDSTVRVGDVFREGGEQATVLRGSSNTHLTGLAWSADGTILGSCGGNGTVTLWDTRTWTVRSVLSGHSRAVYGAAFHPGGGCATRTAAAASGSASGGESPLQMLVSWSSDESVCLWDAARATGDEPEPLATLEVGEGFPVYSCSVSPDGQRFAVAGGGSGGKPAGFLGVPIKVIDLKDKDEST